MSIVRVISVLKSKGINSVITVLKDNPNHDEKGKFASGPHTGDLKKTGDKQGTVPGGIYKDQTTGHSYVVKDYKNNLQAASEHASNQLYRAAGIAVPESSIVQNHQGEGKHSFASQMIDKLGQGKEQVKMAGAQLAKGYGVDALTANWDVIGQGHDNIGFKNNQPIRLDQGGTLAFRAQGGTKDFPATKVDELKSLLDPNKNPNTSAIYNKAFSEDKNLKVESLERAGKITDKEIEHAVKSSFGAVGADEKYSNSIIGGLKGRRDIIAEEAKSLRTSMKQEDEAKAQRVQRLLERAAAIKAGTIKIEEKPRKGKGLKKVISVLKEGEGGSDTFGIVQAVGSTPESPTGALNPGNVGSDKMPKIKKPKKLKKGGPGSGYYAHDGRPPEWGGSAPSGSNISDAKKAKLTRLAERFKQHDESLPDNETLSDKVGLGSWIDGSTGKGMANKIANHPLAKKLQDQTLAALKLEGINLNQEVTLHRGLNLPNSVVEKLQVGDILKAGNLACFTDRQSITKELAESGHADQKPEPSDYMPEPSDYKLAPSDYKHSLLAYKQDLKNWKNEYSGVIITAKTPMNKVLSCHKVNSAYDDYKSEHEWTLLKPGSLRITSIKRSSDGRTYVNAEFGGTSRK